MRYTLYNKLLPLKHVTRSLAQNARVYVSGGKRSRVKIKVTEHIFPRLVRSRYLCVYESAFPLDVLSLYCQGRSWLSAIKPALDKNVA